MGNIEMRQITIEGSTRNNRDEKKRSLISEKAKERWSNPDFKNKMSEICSIAQQKRFAVTV